MCIRDRYQRRVRGINETRMSRKSKRIEGIQFHRWDAKPLSKYRSHFKLGKPTHQPKLASQVQKHFASAHLDFRNDETAILVDFLEELQQQQQQYDTQVRAAQAAAAAADVKAPGGPVSEGGQS
eukprot:TRINITY_DN43157_c0_g1_i1.p1 TRINITY_DN43157_c0_g1~~TRINITY_DN43157_c0_g1_i1.p1  ORF type:complete len:124 (-),score=31.41 TRINITY_DN43157_c0_g1_i1:449-820(-)